MAPRRSTRPARRHLHAIVARLAQRAQLPMPRVYIMHNDQPNAFATGRDPQHAAVAVTTGLLQRLDEREIAGVLAHELAHVRNRDTLTMTITATLAGAIGMLGNFAFLFIGSRDQRDNPFGAIGALLAMIVAPIAAMLVQFAISRSREYEADRVGAAICGEPLALASALAKIHDTALAHRQSGRRGQSGDRPSLHHQPAAREGRRRAVLNPSEHREPHPPAAGTRTIDGWPTCS